MANDVADYLNLHGPQLSGELAAGLTANMTAATARKRVERRQLPVQSLNLQFPRGAQFLYLQSQYGSDLFWNRLAEALVKSKGAYARVIWALKARGGILPVSHFASAVGSNLSQRQVTGDEVFARLASIDLLQSIEVPGLGTCIAFAKGDAYLDDRLPAVRARLISEKILLESIQEWAAKLGLGSYHSFKLRGIEGDEVPMVGTFTWDLTAPSYLGPLATWSGGKPKPGFIAIDVLLKQVVDVEDIQPFLYKCATLRQLKGVGRCLQFFVAHRYTPEAMNLIRRAGIAPATTESLFGTEVALALKELATTLSQIGIRVVDPAKFAELFDRLGKAEAAAGTLRGALFEFIVADIVRTNVAGVDITMNKIYRKFGKDVAEVDVRAIVKNKETTFIECKGLVPGKVLDDKEVKDWLQKRIPIIRAETLDDSELSKLKLRFELWSTGELTDAAKAMINEAKLNAAKKGYCIDVVDAGEIEVRAKATCNKSLIKVVNQHFLQAPLAFPVDVVNQLSKRAIPQDPLKGLLEVIPPSAVDLLPSHSLSP